MAMNVKNRGPDPKVKPVLNMCQQPPFRPMAPSQPDPLQFPLSTSLSSGPPSLQPVQRSPHPPPQPPCPKSLPPPQEEETQAVGDQDSTLEDLCRPLYCKLCNVTLNSTQQAQAHYQGKNHNKKLRNFYAGSQQPPPLRVPEVVEPPVQQPPPPATVPVTQSGSFKAGSRVILATENDYCKLCDASFSSPAVAQAHYQGKNHAKRLRLAEAQQRSTFIDTSQANQRRPRKEGNDFKIMKTRRNAYVPQSMLGPYYNPRPRQRIPRDLAMCVTPSGQFYCSMCNSGASEEAEFRLHLESKHHKSKVSEQRYRSEMENLGYT
ncbi:zinc finger matrin-type protein 3-like isoform X2 [Polyodon spathula]|uniref:zinc finger matrin-type protein 3-like isoform X2 n=1 Tax=Polyodon spathula TaxID=7913 RepID=UPI001B7E972A|nr:zinc finger matrin-type protein 3-like isoform X2 [Polyodon spathula]